MRLGLHEYRWKESRSDDSRIHENTYSPVALSIVSEFSTTESILLSIIGLFKEY